MNTVKLITLLMVGILSATSCKKDEEVTPVKKETKLKVMGDTGTENPPQKPPRP